MLDVKQQDTNKLIPYVNNAKVHSDEQVSMIAASIKEFGFNNPILTDGDNGVIAGHGRLLAAKKLGIDSVPTIELSHLTDAQKKAYILADNRLGEVHTEWDMGLVNQELSFLNDLEFDLELTGFELPETIEEGLTDEDEVPELTEEPKTRLGDVWLLGNHRLMCGDSTSIDAVDTLMDGQKADFCFTSPPYGQQRDYKKAISDWDEMMNGVYSLIPVKEGAQVLVNLGLIHREKEWQPYWNEWVDHMRDIGWLRFAMYVWDQGPGMMGDHQGRLAPSFELIFHFCKENKKAHKTAASKLAGTIASDKGQRAKDGSVKKRSGAGKPIQDTKVRDSVIRVNRQLSIAKSGGHPAPFPVELCKELSNPWTKRGDACYEPFTGSGTQIINCEKESLVFYGMELAPSYVDIAINRWQNFTGKKATLESTGQTYGETNR